MHFVLFTDGNIAINILPFESMLGSDSILEDIKQGKEDGSVCS
jgi:hypothetical protein